MDNIYDANIKKNMIFFFFFAAFLHFDFSD